MRQLARDARDDDRAAIASGESAYVESRRSLASMRRDGVCPEEQAELLLALLHERGKAR
jgi:hypothetical protein